MLQFQFKKDQKEKVKSLIVKIPVEQINETSITL